MNYLQAEPVLIVGAGAGGAALLDIFEDEHLIHVAGIVDANADAVAFSMLWPEISRYSPRLIRHWTA